jgi:hypothetical protein
MAGANELDESEQSRRRPPPVRSVTTAGTGEPSGYLGLSDKGGEALCRTRTDDPFLTMEADPEQKAGPSRDFVLMTFCGNVPNLRPFGGGVFHGFSMPLAACLSAVPLERRRCAGYVTIKSYRRVPACRCRLCRPTRGSFRENQLVARRTDRGESSGGRTNVRFRRAGLVPDRFACGRPGAKESGDDARHGPIPRLEPPKRLTATPAGVRSRPVVGGRQPPVAGALVAHRLEHPLAGPEVLDGTGMAGLAVRVGVALAVARLRVGAAAAAHAHVPGLDRPRLHPGRIVEVRLDRRRRAAEALGDLGDREPLFLPEVTPPTRRPGDARLRARISPM